MDSFFFNLELITRYLEVSSGIKRFKGTSKTEMWDCFFFLFVWLALF